MSKQWRTIKLCEILRRNENTIELRPDDKYREIVVKWWGKGVVLRREVIGIEIAASRRFVAREGQFIISRIDARKGAIAIVPKEMDGAIVTNDFPVFDCDTARVLPLYLGLLSQTASFVEQCERASEGTTNRVRLQEDKFLAGKIVLPPLAEQRRMVVRIEELATQIQEARTVRHQAAEEAEALIHSSIGKFAYDPAWIRKRLTEVAQINPSRTGSLTLAGSDMVSFVPMKAVDDVTGTIAWPEIRPFHEVAKGHTWFTNGDVIFARITPCMQNGKAALAANLVNGVAFGSTEFHVIRPGTSVCGEWLYLLVRHKAFRDDAAEHFKGTAGQQRVPQSFLEVKLIPVPPLPEQRRIVA